MLGPGHPRVDRDAHVWTGTLTRGPAHPRVGNDSPSTYPWIHGLRRGRSWTTRSGNQPGAVRGRHSKMGPRVDAVGDPRRRRAIPNSLRWRASALHRSERPDAFERRVTVPGTHCSAVGTSGEPDPDALVGSCGRAPARFRGTCVMRDFARASMSETFAFDRRAVAKRPGRGPSCPSRAAGCPRRPEASGREAPRPPGLRVLGLAPLCCEPGSATRRQFVCLASARAGPMGAGWVWR